LRCGSNISSKGYNFLSIKIIAIVHKEELGGFWAEVPSLPVCVTQADTIEELQENLKEAIELYLEQIL
jgi:predicted RNase H-like HicB family nuclease